PDIEPGSAAMRTRVPARTRAQEQAPPNAAPARTLLAAVHWRVFLSRDRNCPVVLSSPGPLQIPLCLLRPTPRLPLAKALRPAFRTKAVSLDRAPARE